MDNRNRAAGANEADATKAFIRGKVSANSLQGYLDGAGQLTSVGYVGGTVVASTTPPATYSSLMNALTNGSTP